ncbi:type II secretion system protein [uncultured Luteimonas sp.]|uniref:type II secretion system protein n=1 Tax=uncultured Luteimonas sp. TaxID=453144 RepID=UPI00262AA105|nr:type II secretion system protein [uncultured Luteimonas sp.]
MRRTLPYGFTVVEMLVVLIIISMALTLGFQSLGQWQIAHATLERMSANTRARALTTTWWADSMRGLTPVDERPFRGDAESLDGLTLAPVFGQSGAMTGVRWSIADDPDRGLVLELEENGQTWQFPLDDSQEARFRYLSVDGKVSDAWPSEGLGLEGTNLPAYVELLVRDTSGREDAWTAHVIGPLEQPYKPMYFDDE